MLIANVATRLDAEGSLDGVSLVERNFRKICRNRGHDTCAFAGELDDSWEIGSNSVIVPEAKLHSPENTRINRALFARKPNRTAEISRLISDRVELLKAALYDFQDRFKPDVHIAHNTVTIPMNLPLGIAYTRFLAENPQIKAILVHHDLWQVKPRFSNVWVHELHSCFPPRRSVKTRHACINREAQRRLGQMDIHAEICPNIAPFEDGQPVVAPEICSAFRQEFGVGEGEFLILLPARRVPRKGMEHAIDVAEYWQNQFGVGVKLVCTHPATDEGTKYSEGLQQLAEQKGVSLRFADGRVRYTPATDYAGDVPPYYSVWQAYAASDCVAYPSIEEQFGNVIPEAMHVGKIILVRRYPAFITDIEPLEHEGNPFKFVDYDGSPIPQAAARLFQVVNNPERSAEWIANNQLVGRHRLGLAVLESRLSGMMSKLFGPHTF